MDEDGRKKLENYLAQFMANGQKRPIKEPKILTDDDYTPVTNKTDEADKEDATETTDGETQPTEPEDDAESTLVADKADETDVTESVSDQTPKKATEDPDLSVKPTEVAPTEVAPKEVASKKGGKKEKKGKKGKQTQTKPEPEQNGDNKETPQPQVKADSTPVTDKTGTTDAIETVNGQTQPKEPKASADSKPAADKKNATETVNGQTQPKEPKASADSKPVADKKNATKTVKGQTQPKEPQAKAESKPVTDKKDATKTTNRQSESWEPSSWRSKPIKQVVTYEDQTAVASALTKLSSLPPIVTPTEIVRLKSSLRDAALGNAFLLQGGDCAELFSYCADSPIDAKIKLLLQMSLVLIWGSNKPVIRIGRIAGQYAKPRSSPTEMLDGKEVPSFRGDILNGYDPEQRRVDPERLVSAYFHSATTSNYIRGQLASGIADLHNPLDWELGHVRDEELQSKYTKIVHSIRDSLRFMKTIGADTSGQLQTVDLYTSHEGLVLEYEQSLTRKLKHPAGYQPTQASTDGKGWYNTSAHFIWIGDRTRQIDGGHVEYFRGIENPIGIKVGPSMKTDELVELLDIVNPNKEIGKITLITRYGAEKVESMLGSHIEAVKSSGHVVVWQCDPMHGNTRSTPTGIKTRSFNSIFSELSSALKIHKQHGSYLGGMHLELTGDAVTECTGGSEGLVDEDLSLNYTTYCDPRLNEKQALELAFLVAGHYRADGEL